MTKNMLDFLMTGEESEILDDLRELKFGTFKYISLECNRPLSITKRISPAEAAFIRCLREHKKFTNVIVHEGEPTLADCYGVNRRGREYIKKVKFA